MDSTVRFNSAVMLSFLLMMACFFPYVAFAGTPFDTQPWALAIAALTFLAGFAARGGDIRMPPPLWMMFFVALMAIVSFLLMIIVSDAADLLGGIRSIVGYFTIPLVAYATLRLRGEPSSTLITAVVTAWFISGLLQTAIDQTLFSSIVPRQMGASSAGRGVTGLAPEPVWYARMVLLIALVVEYVRARRVISRRRYVLLLSLCFIPALLFSLSGLGFVYLVWFGVVKAMALLLARGRWFPAVAICLLLATGFVAVLKSEFFENKRVGYLLESAIESPSELMNYRGFSIRASNALIALYGGLVETRGVGFGVGSSESSHGPIPEWLVSLRGGWDRNWGGRVHGGLVSHVYELGIIGSLWILGFALGFSYAYRRTDLKEFVALSFLFLFPVLIFEGTPAIPIAGYILGLVLLCALHRSQPGISRE